MSAEQTGQAEPAASTGKNRWINLLLRFSVPLLALAWLGLTLYSFDALPYSNDCSLHEDAHDSKAETLVYNALLRIRFHGKPSESMVRLISISPGTEPLSVTTNTCEGRRFLTDLITRLNSYSPHVIAIDKFFSEGSCVNPGVNEAFRNAIAESNAQIVVGQATHQRPLKSKTDDCIVETPLFPFDLGTQTTKHKVVTGLTRLNQDTRKIPLQWAVFADDKRAQQENSAAPERKNGFALAAAESLRPDLESTPSLQNLLRAYKQPYGSLTNKLSEPVSAMQVLCTDPMLVEKSGWGNCGGPAAAVGLGGKVVVIGEFSDADLQQTAIGDVYGVELQARYIDDLLQGRYVRTLNYWVDFSLVLAFFALYCFFDLKFIIWSKPEKELKALGGDAAVLALFVIFWAASLFIGYIAPFSVLMSWLLLILIVGRLLFYSLAHTSKAARARGEI